MTRTCHRGTMGMAISILASLVLTQVGAAKEETPSRRHVSPRLIINVPRGSMDGLDSVAYGPAGQLVVSGQWDGQVRVHDPVTGKELRRIDVGPSHSAWVAFSPDGLRMVCAVGYAIREFPLVDFESGKILKTFEGQGHGSRLAVFSPDGRQILTSHAGLWNYNKSEVVCWDAASGERIQQFCLGTDEPVYCARFSPDGQRILTSQRLWLGWRPPLKCADLERCRRDIDPHAGRPGAVLRGCDLQSRWQERAQLPAERLPCCGTPFQG